MELPHCGTRRDQNGKFLPEDVRVPLAEALLKNLADYGVKWDRNGRFFVEDVRALLKNLAEKVNPRPDPGVREFFAESLSEVDGKRIEPVLEFVDSEKKARIFRHACSYWSVPVTRGYGRRLRFIVWDAASRKVMGIFGLCDPVIGLRVRDEYIGWSKEQKAERLYNVMTAFVLGAVPPYNQLLGAKLVALATGSNEVREVFREKYEGRKTLIAEKEKPAELVLVDTMGAFGKSTIYTRLKGWRFVGYTSGYTHYHLSANGLFEELVGILKNTGKDRVLKTYKFGCGPNWKIRVIKTALSALGLPEKRLLNLGVQRGYYVYPLARNWRAFLMMETDDVDLLDLPFGELVKYWKERWFAKRLEG